jgi:hypothetical protein
MESTAGSHPCAPAQDGRIREATRVFNVDIGLEPVR